jgi:hypothetical protein
VTQSDAIRSPVLAAALQDALRGHVEPMLGALARLSGLPGKTPGWVVAEAVGRFLAARAPASDRAVKALCHPQGPEAGKETSAFFPICAAATLGRMAALGREGALETLFELADEPRALVREGIVRALADFAHDLGDAALGLLGGFMTAYLPAAIALEAATTRRVLDRLRAPDALVSRLDEGFDLAEAAPRADQRSQGYRLLVHVLAEASARAMARFPVPVGAMLERRAATSSPDLRRSVERAAETCRRRDGLDGIARALEGGAPARRDPRTYVGPTRNRGKKHKSRHG